MNSFTRSGLMAELYLRSLATSIFSLGFIATNSLPNLLHIFCECFDDSLDPFSDIRSLIEQKYSGPLCYPRLEGVSRFRLHIPCKEKTLFLFLEICKAVILSSPIFLDTVKPRFYGLIVLQSNFINVNNFFLFLPSSISSAAYCASLAVVPLSPGRN